MDIKSIVSEILEKNINESYSSMNDSQLSKYIADLKKERNAASGPLADKRKSALQSKITSAEKEQAMRIQKSLGLEEIFGKKDVVNFSTFAGMYADGAHTFFTDKSGNKRKLSATGDRPRKYYIDDKEVSWEEVKRIVGKQTIHPKQGMNESVDILERVEVDHSRYLRAHGKKARGSSGSWMFTSQPYNTPSSDKIVTVSGSLSSAAKEAAKKLGTNRVYVMESVDLDEASYMINIRKEVEDILGKKLEGRQLAKFNTMRKVGYANPHDIVAQLKNSLTK
jgi:hypothetical protein